VRGTTHIWVARRQRVNFKGYMFRHTAIFRPTYIKQPIKFTINCTREWVCYHLFSGRGLLNAFGSVCLQTVWLKQRLPNFFQVGTTFISQNVPRTTLLLSHLKANCLRFSTTVCDTQFILILFFLSFLD
jgi:hypothetical protein